MRYRVAVDVGGTFTDAVLTDGGGKRLVAIKVATTPANRADYDVVADRCRLAVDRAATERLRAETRSAAG